MVLLMLGTIITFYFCFALFYWLIRSIKYIPNVIVGILSILAFPLLIVIADIKSLPEYLNKSGKWYKYRWLAYLEILSLLFYIYLAFNL